MQNNEDSIFSSFFGTIALVVLYVITATTILESFNLSITAIIILGIVLTVIFLIARKIRKKTDPKNYKKTAILTFIIDFIISLVTAVPAMAFLILIFTGNTYSAVRQVIYKILIVDLLVIAFTTKIQMKNNRKEKERSQNRFKENTIRRISSLLNKEIIKRIPESSQLDQSINLINKLYAEDINENNLSWYTNEVFANKASELLNSLDTLKGKISKQVGLIENVCGDNPYLTYGLDEGYKNNNSAISQCYAILKGQSGEDKAKKILDSLGIAYYDSFDLKDDSTGESVEIDFITVLDGAVYVIEVKNYSADRIILKSSGQFIREKYNKSYNLDTLSQITRHNHFLRKVYGSLNIVNYIVLTDKDTLVDNEFQNESVEVLYVDGLEFKLNKHQSESDRNILKSMNKNRTESKAFPFFNIDDALLEVNKILYENNQASNYQVQDLLTDRELKRLNQEINNIILDELSNTDGYDEYKGLANEIVEKLSSEAISRYKLLLNEI